MSRSARGWSALTVSAAIALTVAACASTETPQAKSGGESVDSTATVPHPQSTVSNAPSATSGIVVANYSAGEESTIGIIDPNSGQYEKLGILVNGLNGRLNHDIRFSPDFKRYAIDRKIGNVNHAGWVNIVDGHFTDVNSDVPVVQQDAFGAPPQSFWSIGFDGHGNFFYGTAFSDDSQSVIFKVPAGQLNGGEPAQLAVDLLSQNAIVRDPNGDLSVTGGGGDCGYLIDGGGWALPSGEFFRESGHGRNEDEQIYKVSLSNCDKVALLPETNRSYVRSPVPSPDGGRVAFQRVNPEQPQQNELWLVGSSGGGSPVQVPVRGVNLDLNTWLLGWV